MQIEVPESESLAAAQPKLHRAKPDVGQPQLRNLFAIHITEFSCQMILFLQLNTVFSNDNSVLDW